MATQTKPKKPTSEVKQNLRINDKEISNRIISYLKKQVQIKKEHLAAIKNPLTDSNKDNKDGDTQQLIAQSNILQLEEQLNAIEMILGIND
jgi:hypothetical protein